MRLPDIAVVIVGMGLVGLVLLGVQVHVIGTLACFAAVLVSLIVLAFIQGEEQ